MMFLLASPQPLAQQHGRSLEHNHTRARQTTNNDNNNNNNNTTTTTTNNNNNNREGAMHSSQSPIKESWWSFPFLLHLFTG